MNIPKSKLTKRQFVELVKKNFKYDERMKCDLYVTIRFDDECGNGHNTFAITGDMYQCGRYGAEFDLGGGCMHEIIQAAFPELKRAIQFHLCTSDGPLHYIANTLYHASDKDYNGLRKGEKKQIRNGGNGKLCWILVPVDESGNEIKMPLKEYKDADEKPAETVTFGYVPFCSIGEGKKIDLTEENLKKRLPALLWELKEIVESFGMEY